MSWIQTYSGIQFWPLNPRQEDVRLEDIAHALSLMCRFNGHCRRFYSVAQHSVLVSSEMKKQGFEGNVLVAALFHDAAEAYLPDICRPIKGAWKEFKSIESKLLSVIYEAFNIDCPTFSECKAIKGCDNVLLATEARDLLGPLHLSWIYPAVPLETKVIPWTSEVSERKFLLEFPTEVRMT